MKSTFKYTFVARGAIAKGRGRGLKPISSLGVSKSNISVSSSADKVMSYNQITETSDLGKGRELRHMCSFEESKNEEGSFHQNAQHASQIMSRPSNSTRSDSTMFAAQELRTMKKEPLAHEKENMQADIPVSLSTDQVMQSTQSVGTSALGKGRGWLRSMCSFKVSENEIPLVHEKEHMQADIPFSPTDLVMQSTKTIRTSDLGKGRELRHMCSIEEFENEEGLFHQNAQYVSQSMSRPSNSTRLDSTMFAAHELRIMKKKPLAHEKENIQDDIPFSPSTDQVRCSR